MSEQTELKPWFDMEGNEIKEGDTVYNSWNDPQFVEVLANSKGELFLGDFDTPFDTPFDNCYAFDEFWKLTRPNSRNE